MSSEDDDEFNFDQYGSGELSEKQESGAESTESPVRPQQYNRAPSRAQLSRNEDGDDHSEGGAKGGDDDDDDDDEWDSPTRETSGDTGPKNEAVLGSEDERNSASGSDSDDDIKSPHRARKDDTLNTSNSAVIDNDEDHEDDGARSETVDRSPHRVRKRHEYTGGGMSDLDSAAELPLADDANEPPGIYNAAEYASMRVAPDVKHLFSFIDQYRPPDATR